MPTKYLLSTLNCFYFNFLLLAASTDVQEKTLVSKSAWFWDLFSKVSTCYFQLDLSSI